jgi:hypothetical protein
MAKKRYKKLTQWGGVNRAISERDNVVFLNTLENLDSNIEEGMLISRAGSTKKQSSGATPNIDKFVMYRDEEWAKDVLLVYDKDATAADRKIYVYTRTSETDDSFAPHSTASYSYGSLRFGDDISFLVHRNGARIGTGTAAANKAMFMGYIDRTAGSDHDAMFGDAIAFNDLFLLKQQWVQQESLVNHGTQIIWDSTREKYYVLTTLGLEIRDSDFYTERILKDITTWPKRITASYDIFVGGLAMTGNSLYAVGKVPDSQDTKLILYDLSNDFNITASADFANASNQYAHCVTTDGTKVYITWEDSTDGKIDEYALDLSSSNTRYTGAGDKFLLSITYDATYVYFVDRSNNDIVRMLIASPYTSSTYSPGVSPVCIAHYSDNLYWASTTIVYVSVAADFNAKTTKHTDTNQENEAISFIGAVPYLAQFSGRIVYFDNVTDFNVDGYIPTKLSLGAETAYPLSYTTYTGDTWFYAISIIDIYGQESHLHRGVSHTQTTVGAKLTISLNVDSENFAEMTSPSTDPAEELSVWNEFRRIKKIRIYRAYNEDGNESEPTTDYTFLRDIDINDGNWSEVVANSLYTYVVEDVLVQADISTVTYLESSGLPESFKPYYTNWLYGIKFNDRYYYGNVRTDELNAHEIIETPINAPDMAYQHDQNIDYFYPGDGDEIKGFAEVWSRMVVFKGNHAGIYFGLNKEKVYDIGTSSPDSILVHNNVVYFVYGTGFYALTPSGYERISEPVDELLSSLTLTSVSGVKFSLKVIHFATTTIKAPGTFTIYSPGHGTWCGLGKGLMIRFSLPTNTTIRSTKKTMEPTMEVREMGYKSN